MHISGKHLYSKTLSALALLLLMACCSFADIKLPAIIADNMVLQQRSKVTLWGWASPGENVQVSCGWNKAAVNIKADQKGAWKIAIPTPPANKAAYTLTFKGNNTIEVKNVLIGEVWLCSGQSNMEFTIAKGPRPWETGVNNYEEEVAKINNPNIREFTVDEVAADSVKTDAKGEWQGADPKNARLFSAVAYYFAREIFEKTGFPIGLINSTWGGTPAESWTSKAVLQADPDLNTIIINFQQKVSGYPQEVQNYQAALSKWKTDTAAAKQQHLPLPKAPVRPVAVSGNNSPGRLYNGMIAPIIPYAIKGVIWYQGESNVDHAWQYRKLFPALIKSWRADRHDQNMPFYFVQISPHQSSNAELRDAQLYTYQTVPRTGMVVTTDNGDSSNIHPRNKENVGKRLALWPLSHDYGFKDLPYSGPIYKSMKAEGNSIRLSFDETNGGLMAKDGDLREFTIAGDDHVFHAAQAKIDGNTLIVSSPLVQKPVAVRFAWRSIPSPNFYNTAGLPASPFRTDDWPVKTQNLN